MDSALVPVIAPQPTSTSVDRDIPPPPGDPSLRPTATTPLNLSQILDATAACLAESGYDGTTIRRIAARLDCAVGSIYRYCTDKRAILAAVTQRRFEPVVQAIDDHVSVARTADHYAAVAADDAQQYRLMFWLASMQPDEADALPAVVRQIIEGWTRQLGDPRIAQRLWMQVHGGVMLGQSGDTLRAAIASVLESR